MQRLGVPCLSNERSELDHFDSIAESSGITPLTGYVVIRRVRAPSATEGGILLPDYCKRRITLKNRNPKPEPACGIVGGSRVGSGVLVGDAVVYVHGVDLWSWWAGGRLWLFVSEGDLLARVELEEKDAS